MKMYPITANEQYLLDAKSHCYINLNKVRDSEWFSYEEEYYWKGILKNLNKDTTFVCYADDNKTLLAIATTRVRFGQKIWNATACREQVLKYLREMYPEGFFYEGDAWDMLKFGMHNITSCASEDDQTVYPAIVNSYIWASEEKLVNIIRDWLENKYLTKDINWKNKIKFEWMSLREFTTRLYDQEMSDIPWQRNGCGHSAFIGFHYFGTQYASDNTKYLMATVDGIPVGCIALGDYPQYGYYAIAYIDVPMHYRNCGIAKMLIKELARTISDDRPLLLSMESEDGKKCHMHECFKREKWPNRVMTEEEYREMSFASN